MLEMSALALAEAWALLKGTMPVPVPTEASILADRKLGELTGVGLEEMTNPPEVAVVAPWE